MPVVIGEAHPGDCKAKEPFVRAAMLTGCFHLQKVLTCEPGAGTDCTRHSGLSKGFSLAEKESWNARRPSTQSSLNLGRYFMDCK